MEIKSISRILAQKAESITVTITSMLKSFTYELNVVNVLRTYLFRFRDRFINIALRHNTAGQPEADKFVSFSLLMINGQIEIFVIVVTQCDTVRDLNGNDK